MSTHPPPTPGAALDAVLAPFLQDEADLEHRLEQTRQQIEELRIEAEQIDRDMDVIRVAKIEALREVAAGDSLLREAFIGSSEHADTAVPDRHPLLSPEG